MVNLERPIKRRRMREPVPPAPRHPEAAIIVPEEVAASLFDRANAQIFQSVGFSGVTKVAQQNIRALAEDYMLTMMDTISRFAHAQRRTRPTVVDFQQMLLEQNISINSLEDELLRVPSTTPVPPGPPLPQSSQEKDFIENSEIVQKLLGAELDGGNDNRPYIPEHLPPFPSKHTYLTTPVFTERPREPRVIREMATQEAMLAENALRKILAAGASGNNKRKAPVEGKEKEKEKEETTETETHGQEGKPGTRSALKKQKRDDVWETAFNAIKTSEEVEGKLVNGVGDHSLNSRVTGKGKDAGVDTNVWLEVIVNSDSQYWRRGGTGRSLKGRHT